MTRNLRHDLKRVAAGVCALMLVSGTVPVKPIAEVINTAIMASAEGSEPTRVYDFTFDEYTGSAEAEDLNTIIKADEDNVKNWIIDNGSAISESNPNYEGLYAFFFYEMYDEEPVICRLIIESSAIGNAETLDTMFDDSSDYQAYVYDTEDEALSDIRAYCDDSHYKVYFAAAATPTTVGTWTSGGCTVTLDSAGTLTVSKSDGGDGVMEDYYDPDTRDWISELDKITNIVVEEGVTSIGIYAFYKCTNLTSVVLPEGLTTIGNSAFGWCENLTSVTIPSTVTSIGSYAFDESNSVTEVYCYPNATDLTWYNAGGDFKSGKATQCHVKASQLAAYQSKFGESVNVTFVGDLDVVGTWTSGGCTLTLDSAGTLTVSKSDGGDGVMTNYYDPDTRDWKNELEKITNIVVEEGVTSIGIDAFYECHNLTSVTLSEGLTTIDSYAFSGCASLTSVTLPEGLTTIGHSGFSGCTNLTSVTLPEGLTTIGVSAFNSCGSLTSIAIPSTVTSIGSEAFFGCNSVSDVFCYPNAADLSWLDGDNDDFMSDKATQCHVKASQLEAYQEDYGGSVNVTFVGDLPVTIVNTWTSGGCTLTLDSEGTLTVSKSADGDGVMANYNGPDTREWKSELDKITNIVVEEDVTSIGIYAFYRCPNLTSIVLPEGLKRIGDCAFGYCENLTSVTIPSTVTSIGSYAFLGCTSVTEVFFYPNAADLTWFNASGEFKSDKATQCHVKASQLEAYESKFGEANVTFMGDLIPVPAASDFTFIAPTATTYDGNIKTATFTKENENIGEITVKYYSDAERTNEVENPTNAGTYYVAIDVAEGNVYDSATKLFGDGWQFTIEQAPVTLQPAEDLTYTGKAQNLVKGEVPAGTKFSFEAPIVFDVEAEDKKINGLQRTLSDCGQSALDSQEYEEADFYYAASSALDRYRNAIYDFADSGNARAEDIKSVNDAIRYMDDLVADFVIAPADDAMEALIYINTYVRGLTAEKLEERCKPVEPDWLDTDTIEATNAGDYVVYYKGDGVNYSDDINSFYVSIAKADPIVTAPIAKTGLLYTGEAQALVEEGTTTGGTLQYGVQVTPNVYTADSATVKMNPALLKDGDVLMVTRASESIIEFTGGTVKYRNSQGDLVPKSIVSINYGNWSSIPPYHFINLNHPEGGGEMLNNVDYNALLVTGKDGDTITLEPYNYTEGDKTIAWSSDVASGTDVGTYEVFYRVIGNDNYNGADAESIENITISKGTPTVTAPTAKTNLIYNGNDQALIEGGSTTGGTIQYSLDGVDFSTEIPEGKTAGNYTVYYKVVGDDNYNSTDVKTVEVTIARADLPVTVTGYEGTFDGNAHGISVDVGDSDAVVYYARESLNADNYADIGKTENPSFTNAGSYRVYYYVTTGNYDPNPVSGSKLVTIKKANAPALTDDQKPTPVDKLVYTGEDQDLVVAPTSIPDGYSIRYSINGGAWISTLPTAVESGTYTVAYKYVENTNYKDIAGETFTITVKDKYTEPMWVWADDYSSATATFIKNDNSSEPIILDAEVTSEVVAEPTYTEYGKTVYIATVKLEGKTYTYRKPVITAKLALTHVEAVPATCDEAGNIEYWFDAENEKYFADDKGETEITKADTIVAPVDHAYGEPQWIWNAENAATATFKCAECGDEQTINAVVTAEVTAPTYTKNGKTVYTATVNFDGKTYTDTLTVTIGKKAYTAPAISYLKGDGAVKLSWNAIEGAERYAIAGFIDGKWKLLNRTEDTSFIIDNLNPGEQYKVAVVAMFDGEYIMDFSNAITVTPKPAATPVYPKITEIEYNEQYHQFKLNWSEVPNAQNYGIAVYLAGKWKIQTQSIPATTTSFTSPKLKAGQTYKMIVCAKVNGKWDLSALSSRAFEVTVK